MSASANALLERKDQLIPRQFKRDRFLDLVNRFDKARVLVVGDFILDQFVWGTVERISPEAPVPVVNVERESYMPGGSLNVAHNIRTMKGTVYPCGVVGRDLAGRLLLKTMRREGIETGGVIYDRARPTSLKTRVIAHSQQVVRFDREKTETISPVDSRKIMRFVKKSISQVDVVILEDYGKGVIQPQLLKEIIQFANKKKTPVLVDPKEKHFSYYNGATLLTPNRKEAFNGYVDELMPAGKQRAKASDGLNVEKVGRGLVRKLKLQSLLMTLGEDGMALFEKDGSITRIPTAAREVFDVSGAGDTVIAVLGMALGIGASMKEAAFLSNLAAGIVVGKLGTATTTTSELKQTIRSVFRA